MADKKVNSSPLAAASAASVSASVHKPVAANMEPDGGRECDRRPRRLQSVGGGPWSVSLLILIKLMLCCSLASRAEGQLSPLVLEEVIEHGPLFDEFEDEAWWSGVDIVDTALRPWPLPEVPGSFQARGQGASFDPQLPGRVASGADDDFCSVFTTDLSAPCPSSSSGDSSSAPVGSGLPSLPRLPPPPPLPPFMADIVKQLHQQLDTNNEECLLCQWAQLNATVDLLPNSEPSTENTWIPMLVVVALVSAMLGAILMIAALKCRRFKVLPRGGSCPTLPVGYMVGEGKDGVQTTEMTGLDSLPKTLSTNPDSSSTMSRPRLDTPTIPQSNGAAAGSDKNRSELSTGWRVKLWRKMTNRSASQILDDYRTREEPYVALPGDGDAISAVYAELNSVSGSIHRPTLDSVSNYPPYHLNTYSEIREPRAGLAPPPPHAHSLHPHHPHHSLHLRRLLSDGTYENAGYAMERGIVLLEHNESGSGCASTPSSAYYSDLSNSDRSGGSHLPHAWNRTRREMNNMGGQGSSQSLPHCCHGRLHHHDSIRARDLMPVALQVIPDNQQILMDGTPASSVAPTGQVIGSDDMAGMVTCCSRTATMTVGSEPGDYFSRGGNSASLNNTSKRPLPPLPSRQLQRPQRRYAYAVNHAHLANLNHLSQLSNLSLVSDSSSSILPPGIDSPLACVPSEYV